MAEHRGIADFARRITELNDTARTLIREEHEFSTHDEPFPRDRNNKFIRINREMMEAARDMTRLIKEISESGKPDAQNEGILMIESVRDSIVKTLEMIRETTRAIQETRNITYREIQAFRDKDTALRAYGFSRKLP